MVGVDVSKEQIAQARQIQSQSLSKGNSTSQSVEYIVQDVSTLSGAELGEFDIITANHLLCYSQSEEELRSMLVATSSCLKRGGRFVGVREILRDDGKTEPRVEGELKGGPMFSYELVPQVPGQPCRDFCHCKFTFRNMDGSVYSFTNFPVFESTMRRMFNENGFKINKFGPELTCSPEGRKTFPPDFIKTLTDGYGQIMWYFDVTKK